MRSDFGHFTRFQVALTPCTSWFILQPRLLITIVTRRRLIRYGGRSSQTHFIEALLHGLRQIFKLVKVLWRDWFGRGFLWDGLCTPCFLLRTRATIELRLLRKRFLLECFQCLFQRETLGFRLNVGQFLLFLNYQGFLLFKSLVTRLLLIMISGNRFFTVALWILGRLFRCWILGRLFRCYCKSIYEYMPRYIGVIFTNSKK